MSTVIQAEKWQAYGNDFVLLPHSLSDQERMSQLARSICDRREGVGADGMVAYDRIHTEVGCRIFNMDGSEAEISGNGIRCLAGLLKQNFTEESVFKIHCGAGTKTLTFLRAEPPALWFRANMGLPDFDPKALPAIAPGKVALPQPLAIDDRQIDVHLVSLGNPHCVVFLTELLSQEWTCLGSKLESHPIFPRRANVEFVRVADRHNIEVRMWERGVGHTFSSGTGSCASAVVSIQMGLTESPLRVHTEKGELRVQWRPGQDVLIDGPAVPVWRGEFFWE
ncbi:MAG: diaminopimelate epimerase [Acidobacteria bacterium]|nr:diaminopimelate epimerase [Acidobacteriota bacterium]